MKHLGASGEFLELGVGNDGYGFADHSGKRLRVTRVNIGASLLARLFGTDAAGDLALVVEGKVQSGGSMDVTVTNTKNLAVSTGRVDKGESTIIFSQPPISITRR